MSCTDCKLTAMLASFLASISPRGSNSSFSTTFGSAFTVVPRTEEERTEEVNNFLYRKKKM